MTHQNRVSQVGTHSSGPRAGRTLCTSAEHTNPNPKIAAETRQSKGKMFATLLTSVVACAALTGSASADVIDINGGASWGGWQSRGQSTDLGIYGGGSTANVYEIYTTEFIFNNNTVSGSPTGSTGFTTPLTPGAFQNGNRILGVGIRHISGATGGGGIIRFDLENDSYSPASSVGGTDGLVSSTLYASQGDFNTQFFGANYLPTSFVVFGAPSDFVTSGSGNGNHAFRAFSLGAGAVGSSYQMFIDLTAIPTVYSTGVFQGNYTVGTIGSEFTISVRGFGNTDSVVVIPNLLSPVEDVRLGNPPNPFAFLPGLTSGPAIGFTWDPVVDHTTFVPFSLLDLALISDTASNLPLPVEGTLLCDLTSPVFTIVLASAPGAPFQIPINANPAFVGVQVCVQGASFDGSSFHLANALDVTVGQY